MEIIIEEVTDVLEIGTVARIATGVTSQVVVEDTIAESPSLSQTPTSSDEMVELSTSAVAREQVMTL